LKKVEIVKKGEARLTNLIREVRRAKEISKCGAIVAFIGFVREKARDGSKVKELYCEADEEKATETLRKIREKILESQRVKEVMIRHVVDTLTPREDTLHIVVAGEHARDAFRASREILKMVKEEAPIWKKEITEKGEYWVSEQEV
jgi:molybdopterin synthase catalytic subunit